MVNTLLVIFNININSNIVDYIKKYWAFGYSYRPLSLQPRSRLICGTLKNDKKKERKKKYITL